MMKRALIIVAVVVLSVSFAYLTYCALRNNAHEFTPEQCGDCHAQTPVANDRGSLVMRDSIEKLCQRCHKQQENILSHPVEMSPIHTVVPPDFPLSWEQKMTCSTCHNIHAAPPAENNRKWYYLRREVTGQALCSICHVRSTSDVAARSSHSQSLGVAHVQFTSESIDNIDAVSQLCLSCHDGGVAPGVDFKSLSGHQRAMSSSVGPNGSHPIGVKYRSSLVRKGELRSREELNPKIKLVKGKLSCVSCHDIYLNSPNLLVVSSKGSKLCLECHNK